MTLGNMHRQDVHHLIAFCLNDACRHQAIIDPSSYPPHARPGAFARTRNTRSSMPLR
jgi:hypothetical protein